MSTFQKATRQQRKARIALYGPSGSGKTYTALSLAKGMGGKVALIDTESYSASLYADAFEFDTCNVGQPTIDNYVRTMGDAAEAGYGVLIIDSLSHAWQELLAEVDQAKAQNRNANSFQAWAKASPKQKRLVTAILNYPGHVIATMRADTAWAVESDERGKQKPVRLGLKPEQGKNIEFEFDILIEIDADHNARVIKDRTGKFQDQEYHKPGEAIGRQIADWLASGSAPEPIETDWSDNDQYKRALVARVGDAGKGFTKQQWTDLFDAAARVFDGGKHTSFMGIPADRREAFVGTINVGDKE